MAAKRAIVPEDLAEGLLREHDARVGQVVSPAAERLIRGGLAHGAQTRDGERDLEGLLRGLAGSGGDEDRAHQFPVDRVRLAHLIDANVVDRRVAT
ncbi:hypothetical protein ACWGN9_27205 [Streptomyces sp. NPDC055775]